MGTRSPKELRLGRTRRGFVSGNVLQEANGNMEKLCISGSGRHDFHNIGDAAL
jgi:hypothetical protein